MRSLFGYLSLVAVLLIVLLFASCTKEGPTGPAGPAGKNGNANVMTRIITVYDSMYTNATWNLNTSTTSATLRIAKVASIADSAITPGIVDSGMVFVYFRPYLRDTSWTPLSYKFLSFDGNYSYNFVFNYKKYMLRLYVYLDENYSGATVPSIYTLALPPYQFKYLIVSGTSLTVMRKMGVDPNNEQEVEYFLKKE